MLKLIEKGRKLAGKEDDLLRRPLLLPRWQYRTMVTAQVSLSEQTPSTTFYM